MADLVFPPLTTPGQNGPLEYAVYDMWSTIPDAMELVIYDDKIPQGVLPHDHGDRRGSLIDIPVTSIMMGPQAPSGGLVGSWEQGVPMFPPLGGQSFVTEPKLLFVMPLLIPANVSLLHVELIFFMDGLIPTRSVDLVGVIRPVAEHGMKPGFGSRYQVAITHTDITSPAVESRNAIRFTDMSQLGEVGLTKSDLILEIWLVSNPTVTTTYRLLHVAPFWGTEATGNPTTEPVEWSGQKVIVDPASFRAGHIVESAIAVGAHKRLNQVTVEALGRAPGLAQNIEAVDEGDEYLHYVRRRHRHYGRKFTDPYYDERSNDGAVIRTVLWSQCFFWNYGDSASDMTINTPEGVKLHPNGSLSVANGWFQPEGRLELAIGQRSFDVRVGIAPRTSEQLARVWMYADVVDPVSGQSLDFYFGMNSAVADTAKSGAFTKALITPINGRLWQRNSDRVAAGLGLWTEQAAVIPTPANSIEVSRLTRFSKDVRIVLSSPLTRTGGVILRLAFELETGALGSGTRPNNSTLNFIDVFTPAGF